MDRFDAMRLFTRIVELGSFTKAANDLNLPRATVTHVIQQLEKRLGVRLLQRTTRHVSATLDGNAYYARCIQLMADLEEAETAFDTSSASPKGRLRVDFHGTLAMHFVLPQLPQFLALYPDIELEIGMGDRAVDLVREGIDCVLRVGQLKESSLVARQVASLSQVTCAGSAYLEKMGTPQTLEDLQRHQAVNFFSSVSGKILPFEFLAGGKHESVLMKGRVAVNTAEAYVRCCIDNLGLIQVPRYHVEQYLADGRLREVLPQLRPAPMPVSIMYPHHRQLSRRVRVLVDWVADLMSRGEK